MNAGVVP